MFYFITQELLNSNTDIGDLQSEFCDMAVVARVETEDLKSDLSNMEDQCKTSLGFIKLSRNYNEDTRELVSSFLINAANRILSMEVVMAGVGVEYKEFLSWLGIPPHLHKVLK